MTGLVWLGDVAIFITTNKTTLIISWLPVTTITELNRKKLQSISMATTSLLLNLTPKVYNFRHPRPKRTNPILARTSSSPSSSTFSSGAVTVKEKSSFPGKPEADVVVIGSGIAGLCCGGLLARYEEDVIVLESHDLPGGAAHSFDIKGFKFDSGPSLFSGFQSRGPQANPLAQVLDALDERIPCVSYDSWMVYVPEGEFLSRIGPTEFFKTYVKCYLTLSGP